MSKELCRVIIETNEYYRTLDENDYDDYFDEDLDREKYYATKYPNEQMPK